MTPLVEARSLVVETTAGTRLVGPLDLTIAVGERVGLIGRSGAGKTLVSRALVGRPAAGLRIMGSVRWAEVHGCRRTGLLGQDSASTLDPLTRVGRQLGLPLASLPRALPRALSRAHPRAHRRARVSEVAAQLDLDPALLDRWPTELSGGQRQRAALALALVDPPALLVADEPTSALDPDTRDHVLACLDRALPRTSSLLLISHDLDVVERTCDRVVVLDAGLVVDHDAPAARALTGAARELRDAR